MLGESAVDHGSEQAYGHHSHQTLRLGVLRSAVRGWAEVSDRCSRGEYADKVITSAHSAAMTLDELMILLIVPLSLVADASSATPPEDSALRRFRS